MVRSRSPARRPGHRPERSQSREAWRQNRQQEMEEILISEEVPLAAGGDPKWSDYNFHAWSSP